MDDYSERLWQRITPEDVIEPRILPVDDPFMRDVNAVYEARFQRAIAASIMSGRFQIACSECGTELLKCKHFNAALDK